MAETLISPGVLARENDSSQITSQPVQAGAAIVGPTVKGNVNIPTLVTTYSEYLANFGSTFTSGSDEYSFLTSISAFNYFQNGGTSLLVTKVASGSFSAATSSIIAASASTDNAFTLKTLGEGTIMNSTSTEGTNGSLPSGTVDNVRWEIVNPDISNGFFFSKSNEGTNNLFFRSYTISFTMSVLHESVVGFVNGEFNSKTDYPYRTENSFLNPIQRPSPEDLNSRFGISGDLTEAKILS